MKGFKPTLITFENWSEKKRGMTIREMFQTHWKHINLITSLILKSEFVILLFYSILILFLFFFIKKFNLFNFETHVDFFPYQNALNAHGLHCINNYLSNIWFSSCVLLIIFFFASYYLVYTRVINVYCSGNQLPPFIMYCLWRHQYLIWKCSVRNAALVRG